MTHTLLVPAMYNLCLLEPRFANADLSDWRLGGYRRRADGNRHHRSASAEKLPQLQLMNAYGATETTSPGNPDAAG